MPTSPLPIAIGEDNFRILREKGGYYIDKSLLVEEVANSRARGSILWCFYR